MVDLNIKKENGMISMSEDDLEHIMGCLANQKFINSPPINGDSLEAELNGEADKVRKEHQASIDHCYRQIEKAVCA